MAWTRILTITTFVLFINITLAPVRLRAQDATGAIRGTVVDASGGRIAQASVVAVNIATSVRFFTTSNSEGHFAIEMLPPGEYFVRAIADGMSPQITPQLHVDVGGAAELQFRLTVAGAHEQVTVSAEPAVVDTKSTAVSTLLDERALANLPLNGRRFSDLMLLSPGVTQDPRSLTSGTNGDLSFGGIRGFQNSFLVDGSDYNNGFYAQALGRYRAPYLLSTDVVQEFRVSSNSYGAEQGRSGGAVVNVVTKSGSNHAHGTAFYNLRDSSFGAADPFLAFKPHNRQQQLGGTFGGPLKRNKIFFFAGFDQHIFHIPNVVEFLNGSSQVVPQPGTGPYTPGDYDSTDEDLVFAAAAQLTSLAGEYPSAQIGFSSFGKLDINLTPRNQLALRMNTTRYWGSNNVFLDPGSPVTYDAISDNGQETVATVTANLQLTSSISPRWISHLRAQFSRDLQQSYSNTSDVLLKIPDILDGVGRSDLLPRQTRQHRASIAETFSFEGHRNSWKFGGDGMMTWIYDFFPSQQSGEFLFYPIKVDPFTYEPMEAGLELSPLRAYAHEVPHYYLQSFGSATSNPNSNDYAAFAQDTIHVSDHLAVNLGVRWDLQTFTTAGLMGNPLFPPAGKVPFKPYNFGPRAGLAYSFGKTHPLVVRAGYGIFYVRIPDIYNSIIQTENGVTDSQVFLNNTNYYDNQVFPAYPNPLVTCSQTAASCSLPAGFTQGVTNEVSAFAPNFVTPRVQQASLSFEREIADRTTLTLSLLNVRGQHLIRALDVNLPQPAALTYPIFDSTGSIFQGGYYTVDSFATWQFTQSLTCPFPPCINPLGRPIANLGAIDEFQSEAYSVYNGATLSLNRRVARGTYLRLSATYARAIDDGQDALVAGQPATVQNSYDPNAERGPSVTDQRYRVVAAFSVEPRPFHREHPLLGHIFNEWRASSVFNYGSGRPVNATVDGDPNQDGNDTNDRLPGYSRNAFTGPDYATTDLRLTRKIRLNERFKLNLVAESFNLFNRDNQRVDITSNGLVASASTFVQSYVTAGIAPYPGYYQLPNNFMKPNAAFAPRQVQLAVKLIF
ncbi:MAG TPA: carboxypeptidase regulatory-like domain-containing protein [Terriglobales bacterium]|nr:carboxypeptidase regulatory-like domain-containing protein [Terriglobales bacterium]